MKQNKKFKIFKKLNIKTWSISSQIFLVIGILFLSYYLLIKSFTKNILQNYYENKINEELKNNDYNVFKTSLILNHQYNIYPLHINKDFKLINSDIKDYYLSINGSKYYIKNYYITFNNNVQKENIEYIRYNGNQEIVKIKFKDDNLITSNSNDDNSTKLNIADNTDITDFKVTEPLNTNFLFEYLPIIDANKNNLKNYYDENKSFYLLKFEKADFYVFFNQLEDSNDYIATFVPINNMSLFMVTPQLTLYYAILFIILFGISILLINLITKPIKKVTSIADKISTLDFSSYADCNSNKEITKLSQSLNTLSSNLSYQIDKLNKQNKEIKIYSEKQVRDFEIKKQLVASMSHELKTPLFVIQATLQGIIDGIFKEDEVKQELENIMKEIENTTKIIQEILGIYNLESQNFKLNIKSLDLIKLNHEILESLSQNIKVKNLKVTIRKNKENIRIKADYQRFKKVLENLIVNAIKYTPDNNLISINIFDTSEYVLYEITNFGVTIKEEHLPFLFDPFYKVDNSGNKGISGSGLGLYLVKETLDKHKFKYEIKNVENGVSFSIIINKKGGTK